MMIEMPFAHPTTARTQSGQVGLIVLLIMAVVLTVGLSLISRSTEQNQISIEQENATRVFNAAESGVEESLSTILQHEESNSLNTLPENLNKTVGSNEVETTCETIKESNLEIFLNQGETFELTPTAPGTLTISWWKQNTACSENPAAVLVSHYYDDAGTTRVNHFTYGTCEPGPRGDNFTVPTISPSGYRFVQPITTTAATQVVRVTPLYNSTDIRVVGSLDTPQFTVNCQATNLEVGTETKAIEVERTRLAAPHFMDFALFSGTTITQSH